MAAGAKLKWPPAMTSRNDSPYQQATVTAMTGPQDDTGDEDTAVWKRLTAGVKPYKREAPPEISRPSATTPKPKRKSADPSTGPSAGPSSGPGFMIGQGSSFRSAPDPIDLRRGDHAGIDRSTRRRLAQGQYPIEARLDLHGMTAAQAERQLSRFIGQAVSAEKRCVLVITGKGANNNGVLKRLVPMWLKSPPLGARILALSQAIPADGGDGALYVMLRRRRNPE